VDKIGTEILILLYILGFGLLLVELFVPGMIAGIIGLLLIGFVIVAIITTKSVFWGLVLLAFTIVAGALVIRTAVRRFSLRKSLTRAEGYSSAREDLKQLLGREGVVLTMLRPSGTAEFDGQRVDGVSAGEIVSKETRIKVIEVEGNRVVVRTLDVSE
jgi:membrane-bound ClpP family serine protease